MKVRFTLAALRQIERILGEAEVHSPHGAAGMRTRFSAVIGLLEDYPLAGQATSRKGARRIVLTPYPYILFYRVVADEIIVTRIRHGAGRPLLGEGLP
ncbi:hypothetical protein ASF53_18325 [Methylobacterium sp. Leaf123]|uniref:type II toxin-antitoxin system RelE/ParE family toxin n=1 Tax=Methylobacterium sp. Leaf123 TaxID=1736264 RepID=UPI000700F6AE|nr:type II toxin-antitoxin system RelE/ParE family toxin [Methylobacterium sp. Leaf123]KQQ30731.1 hypothetical protein ASF53_18325 [Methylobacterium sp. Leaf123]